MKYQCKSIIRHKARIGHGSVPDLIKMTLSYFSDLAWWSQKWVVDLIFQNMFSIPKLCTMGSLGHPFSYWWNVIGSVWLWPTFKVPGASERCRTDLTLVGHILKINSVTHTLYSINVLNRFLGTSRVKMITKLHRKEILWNLLN